MLFMIICNRFQSLFTRVGRFVLRVAVAVLFTLALTASAARAQEKLPVRWEELTGPDFIAAIHEAQGVCVLPFGILEKHGPHLPMGTDLLMARYTAVHAAQQEYAVVFPQYYFGQIAEARFEPGSVSYSRDLLLQLLQETTDEMARNGCKKIIIANAHGGNTALLPYFGQMLLASRHDYVIYIPPFPHLEGLPGRPALKSKFGGHADEAETSAMLVVRPDLVHMDRVASESGADLHRLTLPEGVLTSIWWYASFPNHYAGEASAANRALGEFDMNATVKSLVETIRAVKADNETLRLQNEFYDKADHPLETKQ